MNTPRISRDDALMEIAFVMAKRSTCNRMHVGAVIGSLGRVISAGYAGAPSGLPHCHPDTCNVNQPCTRTVHAEAGAIAYAARVGISVDGATLYCTHCPCLDCAKLIINSGIKNVIYSTPYRKKEGLELLTSAGVGVVQWQEPKLRNVPELGIDGAHLPMGNRTQGCEDHGHRGDTDQNC